MKPALLSLVLGLALLTGCGAGPGQAVDRPVGPGSSPTTATSPTGTPDVGHGRDPYIRLARALDDRGVGVWFETDLVSAWLAGPPTFDKTVRRLARLGHVPGVVGFKIADELGYHDGISSPGQATAFLRAAHRALARVAPHAQVLIDMVVPQLGCLPSLDVSGRACAAAAAATAPAATVGAVTRYLRTGWVDRLDLSTGLLDGSTYVGRGTDLKAAQRQAWTRVQRLGWSTLTTLQARKALAEPGGFQGTTADARSDLALYVGIPMAAGASAVDIWTWRQPYGGATVSLLPPSLQPNPLWIGMERLQGAGVPLLTHMTPSQMPTRAADFAHECDVAASVFTAVFVAAGTG
jgi:hypothetical protein